ncbi:MAG: DUF4350 domain-containing protein [Wenzhouxiangellaceae bacterium]
MLNSKWARYLWLLLGALVLGSGLAWFFTAFDRVEVKERSNMQAAALADPWLAATRFLQGAGAQVRMVSDFNLDQPMPPPEVTLIGSHFLQIIEEQRVQRLREWIEAGGHLLVPVDWNAPLVGDAGISLGGIAQPFGVEVHFDGEAATTEPLRFSWNEHEAVTVRLDRSRYFSFNPVRSPALRLPEEEPVLLQYAMGEGQMTLISDMAFASNWNIGDLDHAWFFYQLSGAAQGRPVWLLDDRGSVGLLAWLWRHGAFIILSLALLLAALIWRRNRRLGPLQEVIVNQRRHLGEHLQATANFLWRQGLASTLISASRARIMEGWLLRHPPLRAQSSAQRAAWLAERLDLDVAAVDRALHATTIEDRRLVELTRTLQKLRRGLPRVYVSTPEYQQETSTHE